ncbi:MAG: ABC transporter ATP-binding protein [Muribaculaceae bacterium]|nr:ABC transporter ATP-binding protein [Muribaculaceae bacterium]
MSNIAIQFENIGKLYHLGVVGTGTLSHDLNRWWQTRILHHEDPYLKIGETNDRSTKGSSDFVWALKDISFNVMEGDVVGIIGKNGAGKSTLLKLLSRVTAPTTGIIRAKGRIASLLEVGTGFHPEMTGRENIYMNGSIMGMTRQEITKKLDSIVDFAGVERYLDTPVKRYSSGMTVRLGFAVAAFLEPEILVVDEVLAVGDAEFQKKAIGKMQDVSKGEGRTVLFVSHNMAAIKSLCTRGVVLQNGMVVHQGSADQAVDFYLNHAAISQEGNIKDAITDKKTFITIDEIAINGSISNQVTIKSNEEFLDLCITGHTSEPISAEIKLFIKNMSGVSMAGLVEGRYKGISTKFPAGKFQISKKIKIPHFVSNGDYYIDLYLHQPLIQDFFYAPHCADLHFEGNFEGFGKPLIGRTDGFFGLETQSDEN